MKISYCSSVSDQAEVNRLVGTTFSLLLAIPIVTTNPSGARELSSALSINHYVGLPCETNEQMFDETSTK